MKYFVDTGPLVAALDKSEAHHGWAVERLKSLPAPMTTCEAVIAEAAYLLRSRRQSADALFEFLQVGALCIEFDVQAEHAALRRLMARYAPRMDFADSCLVRMTELEPRCRLLTLDSDFLVYRRRGRQVIPLELPDRH
jgi:predicted nucleic acid-binding protein